MNYLLYTDGATTNNGQKNSFGGWAWALYDENGELIDSQSGHLEPTTNNICEMTAIVEGCERVLFDLGVNDNVTFYSDSAYCMNCYKQKWYINWKKNGWVNSKKEPVKNKELWERLIPFFENKQFHFEKVKGHSTDERNNYVDKLAVEAKFNEHICD